jgi:hypothetical protein
MKRYWLRFSALGLALLLLPIGAAYGQATLPVENHYKVYTISPGYSLVKPITLIDQFGVVSVDYLYLDRFANPAEKRVLDTGQVYPIVDPLAHLKWWHLDIPQPVREVIAIDQFGYGPVKLGNAVYLLTPTLKNPPPPPVPPLPYRNHYLCYEVIGSQPVYKRVALVDQFGVSTDVMVLQPKYFCNPVEKHADGRIYPIMDYKAHLQCYQVDNPAFDLHGVVALDQFGYHQFTTYRNDCLCLPALKEHIVGTERSTWGQIKSLYR